MKELKGTNGSEPRSFSGESARASTMHASQARKQGYETADSYRETALNEKSTRKCGLNNLGGAVPKTTVNLKMPPQEKTTSGPKCIELRKMPKKKVSRR